MGILFGCSFLISSALIDRCSINRKKIICLFHSVSYQYLINAFLNLFSWNNESHLCSVTKPNVHLHHLYAQHIFQTFLLRSVYNNTQLRLDIEKNLMHSQQNKYWLNELKRI